MSWQNNRSGVFNGCLECMGVSLVGWGVTAWVLLILATGCSPAPPRPETPSKPTAAFLSCQLSACVHGLRAVATIDPDVPAPGGPTKCDNCNGTGKLGDGRVFTPCPVCGGDGVIEAGKSGNVATPKPPQKKPRGGSNGGGSSPGVYWNPRIAAGSFASYASGADN